MERLRELLRLRDLLGVSLDELRELAAAESARAALRAEWTPAWTTPCAAARSSRRASGYIERQLELVRRRRDELDGLEDELVARRRRLRSRLRERSPTGGVADRCSGEHRHST